MKLQDKVIIITGASSGIGEATARLCAQQGAKVVLAARRRDLLEKLAAELGAQAIPVVTDVTDDAQVKALIDTTLERFGQIDILINSAGKGLFKPVLHAPIAELDELYRLNVHATVTCTQAVLPTMLQQRSGRIINIASMASYIASANLSFYTATKYAVLGWSRSLQAELLRSGVNCTVICPYIVRTPFYDHADKSQVGGIAFLPDLKAMDVAQVIVRCLRWGSTAEVVIPGYAAPIVALCNLFPGLVRLVHWILL